MGADGHGCIRCANGAEPKQKLRKWACKIFALFLPIPAYWNHPSPSEQSVVSSFPTAPRLRSAENFFIRVDSRGFAVVCLSRPRRPCPLLFCLGPLRRADPTFFRLALTEQLPPVFLCALAALRENLGTAWARADGDVGAPGTGFPLHFVSSFLRFFA